MTNKTPELVDLTNVDFCVATTGNREALENLLESIVGRHTNATITIADNSYEVDRSYYKTLMADLAESGLSNRVRVHQAPYGADANSMRNFLASNTTSKYKLFLTEDMVFGEETDVAAMVAILEKHPSIGVVVAGVDGKLVAEKRDVEIFEEGKPTIFRTPRIASPFMIVHTDVMQRVRFEPGDDDMVRFAAALPHSAAFGIAATPDVFIHLQKEDAKTQTPTETQTTTPQAPEPTGPDNGNAAQPNVPSTDAGNQTGGNSVHSGEAAPKTDKVTSGRQGGGNTGPVRGK